MNGRRNNKLQMSRIPLKEMYMESNYWARVLGGREVSRRRAISVAGGGVTAAALLAACGGSSSSGSSSSSPVTGGTISSTASPSSSAAAKPAGDFTPSDGPPKPGGRYIDQWSTTSSWNPVSQESEGTR